MEPHSLISFSAWKTGRKEMIDKSADLLSSGRKASALPAKAKRGSFPGVFRVSYLEER